MLKQKTLKDSFSLSGKGLHTGLDLTVTFNPAPADHATREALTVIKTNQPVSDELLDKIAKEIDAISAFSLNL